MKKKERREEREKERGERKRKKETERNRGREERRVRSVHNLAEIDEKRNNLSLKVDKKQEKDFAKTR